MEADNHCSSWSYYSDDCNLMGSLVRSTPPPFTEGLVFFSMYTRYSFIGQDEDGYITAPHLIREDLVFIVKMHAYIGLAWTNVSMHNSYMRIQCGS